MSDQERMPGEPWRHRMGPRDPSETHRQASFLELFFDLCFVVAIAAAAAELHHAVVEDHVRSGVISYLTVFFSIWWAWMNFTWFASAYDNDDAIYRLGTLVQIVGTLILAAGVGRAFRELDFSLVFIGYAVMRAGLIGLWLRASRHDPARRTTTRRYALGLLVAMGGWSVMFVSGHWPLWGWWSMALVELAIPVWAERAGTTPWHRHHIAERYGLLTIIVLGESILAATHAVQDAVRDPAADPTLMYIIAGGVLIVFSMWWLYFSRPAHRFLTSTRIAFIWGYGHYMMFAAAAAVGAGLGVNLDLALGHGAIEPVTGAAAVTVPVAAFLLTLWLLHIRPGPEREFARALPAPAAALMVTIGTFGPRPVFATGLILAGLVIFAVAQRHREHRLALRSAGAAE